MSEENQETVQDNTEAVNEQSQQPVEKETQDVLFDSHKDDDKSQQSGSNEIKEDAKEPDADDSEDKQDNDAEEESGDYKLEKPEDSLLTDADMERIESYAKDQGLSKEAADKLVETQAELLKEAQERQAEEYKELTERWKNDALNDKEIGGDNLKRNIELSKRALEKFAKPEFIEMIDESGYGNHPELIRTFMRIGKAMSDDQFIHPGAQASGEKTLEDIFYGKN